MNRATIATEILKIAKELVSMDFDTEEEMKKYKQEHDVRPGTKLKVKKSEKPGNSAKKSPGSDFLDRAKEVKSDDDVLSLIVELKQNKGLTFDDRAKVLQHISQKGFRIPTNADVDKKEREKRSPAKATPKPLMSYGAYDDWIDDLQSFDEGKSIRKSLEDDSGLKPADRENLTKKLDSIFWKQRWPKK